MLAKNEINTRKSQVIHGSGQPESVGVSVTKVAKKNGPTQSVVTKEVAAHVKCVQNIDKCAPGINYKFPLRSEFV